MKVKGDGNERGRLGNGVRNGKKRRQGGSNEDQLGDRIED